MAEEMPVITGDRYTILGNLIIVMISAGLLGLIILLSDIRFYAEPISEGVFGPAAAIANAILFVVLATVGATMVVILLKYRKERLLKLILIGAFGFIAIVIFLYFGSMYLVVFQFINPTSAILILSVFILASVVNFITVEPDYRMKNGGLLLFGSAVGAFLGVVLPVWTSVLLLIGLAIYDYYSVKKGPIRKIVEMTEDDPDKLGALAVSTSEWDIGLGDVAFYGMIVALAIVNPIFGVLGAIFATMGIIAGFLITLKLLEQRGVMAGLPIPVALALIGLTLGYLVQWVLPLFFVV
jgi:presenilin-like A22 family membrane protease